jgi:hypothetical protein
MTYLEKDYSRVEAEVNDLIVTGTYSRELEKLPIILVEDIETFHIGG